jgi:four helix bundle protein
MATQGFEQLAAWQQAMDLTHRLFRLTEGFAAEERSGLTATLRRVSAALAARIAEATAYDDADKLRDACVTGRGTLREIQTHLLIARRLGHCRGWGLWRVQRAIRRLDLTLDREIDSLDNRRQILALAPCSDADDPPAEVRRAA